MYKKYSDLPDTIKKEQVDDVYEIKSMDDKMKIINDHRVVMINIHGDWCGPCKSVAPQISVLARQYYKKGEYVIVKENVDHGLSKEVRGVPAFHFYKNGKKVHEITGANIEEIKNVLEQLIKSQ
jgi:thioredoxin 1